MSYPFHGGYRSIRTNDLPPQGVALNVALDEVLEEPTRPNAPPLATIISAHVVAYKDKVSWFEAQLGRGGGKMVDASVRATTAEALRCAQSPGSTVLAFEPDRVILRCETAPDGLTCTAWLHTTSEAKNRDAAGCEDPLYLQYKIGVVTAPVDPVSEDSLRAAIAEARRMEDAALPGGVAIDRHTFEEAGDHRAYYSGPIQILGEDGRKDFVRRSRWIAPLPTVTARRLPHWARLARREDAPASPRTNYGRLF